MDVLLEGGPRHQHWVSLPDPLPDVLVEDDGEYVRMGDAPAYAWVLKGKPSEDDEDVEHIRPAAPPARTHAPAREPRTDGDARE